MSLQKSFSFLQKIGNHIINTRSIYTSRCLQKVEDRKEMLASLPAKDEGTAGERSIDIDTLIER